MPRKRKPGDKPPPVSEKTRAEDDRLREMLRTADLKKFDRAIAKAIKPASDR